MDTVDKLFDFSKVAENYRKGRKMNLARYPYLNALVFGVCVGIASNAVNTGDLRQAVVAGLFAIFFAILAGAGYIVSSIREISRARPE